MPELPYPYDSEAQLPAVVEHDILQLIVSEVLDPRHLERWDIFVAEQPVLAKEIRNRLTMSIPDIEARKIAIDEISYAYTALRNAMRDPNTVPSALPEQIV